MGGKCTEKEAKYFFYIFSSSFYQTSVSEKNCHFIETMDWLLLIFLWIKKFYIQENRIYIIKTKLLIYMVNVHYKYSLYYTLK